MSLVHREGDPEAGVALAVAHDLGSRASVVLSELVAFRMRNVLRGADSVAFGTGFAVRALAPSAEAAARFVETAPDLLSRAPSPTELDVVQRRMRTVGMERWTGTASEAVGRCSGELGGVGASTDIRPSASQVASWLKRIRAARTVAFAATGPREVLDAAAEALAETGQWPTEPVLEDPWPQADVFSASSGAVGGGALSVALRVPDGAWALAAARALSAPGSALSDRLRHVDPPWTIDAVDASTRARGACVRIDVRAARASEPPTPGAAAGVAWLVLDELRRAAARGDATPWDLDEGVLRATDPRDAASIAAWRALSGQLPAGPPRRFVNYRLPSSRERPDVRAEFERAMRSADAWKGPTFDLAARVEPGQGEFWLLLANPCGTSDETRADAGLRVLAMRALAEAAAPRSPVVLEPWLTPDGVGLLAHAPKASGNERPQDHAERIAAAIARAVATPRVAEDGIAGARAHLLAELDADRDALVSASFEALVPGRPSLLDPRGGFQQLVSLTSGSVATELRRFSSEPLRLAVLANHDEQQAHAAAEELSRWLRPGRQRNAVCAPPQVPAARPGVYTIETRRSAGLATRAVVGVRLGAEATRRGSEAEWTVFLLNRAGGWLERSLEVPGIATGAEASFLGGSTAGAIVVEIAANDQNADEAVAQVRALLGRLATGAATAYDVESARIAFAAANRSASLDPRRRIVELWRGKADDPAPTLESLRRFHASAFGSDRHVVVIERPKP